MRVITLPYADSPAQVSENVRRVADLTGRKDTAAGWQRQFDQLANERPGTSNRALVISSGGLGVGPATQQWLELAGLTAIAPRPGLSHVEQIVTINPDIIIESRYRAGQYSRNTEWRHHPLAQRSNARRIAIDGRSWTCGGPLMLDEIERLQAR